MSIQEYLENNAEVLAPRIIFDTKNISIVYKKDILFEYNIDDDIADVIALLFCIYFIFNIEYPPAFKQTFYFFQHFISSFVNEPCNAKRNTNYLLIQHSIKTILANFNNLL